MYGRVFDTMFTGSMQGSGAVVFTVWTYVIANMREDRTGSVEVELRPRLLSALIGETQEKIEEAIGKLCGPDPESTCQQEDGRRLMKVGPYSYRVVSGPAYILMRNEHDLREYRRLAKRKERAKLKQDGADGRLGGAGRPRQGGGARERLAGRSEEALLRQGEIDGAVLPGAGGSYGPEAEAVLKERAGEPEPDEDAAVCGEVLKELSALDQERAIEEGEALAETLLGLAGGQEEVADELEEEGGAGSG